MTEKEKRLLQASYRAGGGRTHTVSLPTDFKSVASAYSATTPSFMEVPIRFELMITELQSIALPLGYGTISLTAHI